MCTADGEAAACKQLAAQGKNRVWDQCRPHRDADPREKSPRLWWTSWTYGQSTEAALFCSGMPAFILSAFFMSSYNSQLEVSVDVVG